MKGNSVIIFQLFIKTPLLRTVPSIRITDTTALMILMVQSGTVKCRNASESDSDQVDE